MSANVLVDLIIDCKFMKRNALDGLSEFQAIDPPSQFQEKETWPFPLENSWPNM